MTEHGTKVDGNCPVCGEYDCTDDCGCEFCVSWRLESPETRTLFSLISHFAKGGCNVSYCKGACGNA